MNYATNFAVIGDGIVTNVLWGMVYNMPTDFPNTVQTDDLAVSVGDTYDGTHFYHDGVRVLTREERYAADLAEIEEALNE